MRLILITPLALCLIGAGEPPYSALDNPAYTTPSEAWKTMRDATGRDPDWRPEIDESELQKCRDTITQAREATGQPPLLQREPASPDKPQAIYAVDRRQDGCSVMVMMGDREDIRPLPLPADGAVRVLPVEDEQP